MTRTFEVSRASGERHRYPGRGAEGDDDERRGTPGHQQDEADEGDAEVSRRMHGRGPYRIVEGRAQYADDRGVHAPHRRLCAGTLSE